MPATMYYADTGTSSAATVWRAWSSTTASASETVWPTWVEGTDCTTSGNTCAFSSSATTVWVRWNTTATTCGTTRRTAALMRFDEPVPAPRELAAEETAKLEEERLRNAEEQRRRNEECQRRATEEHARREEAARKAEVLLRDNLSAEQREEYARDRAFHVVTAGGRRYRVECRRSGNVAELNAQGKAVARYCVHPAEDVPDQDTMLAQKLWLEADEEAFRRTANRSQLAV